MNELEQECVILNTAWDVIDGMVNWAMFVKTDRPNPSNLLFETSAHAQLFNILLGDFLSVSRPFNGQPIPFGLKPAPPQASPANRTFLLYLRQVCDDPKLGSNVHDLKAIVERFAGWLEGIIRVEGVNLPDIDVVADITVARYRYLKICGDIAKHSLPRLAGNVNYIRDLVTATGHPISEQEAYLAINNFYEWFHRDIFHCHSSLIAEFLNDLRWAIYEYLQPEYRRSWYPTEIISGAQMYGYRYPEGCSEPAARAMYWDLMNRVRGKPWIPRFSITGTLRSRY
jgi:hypothetical protein